MSARPCRVGWGKSGSSAILIGGSIPFPGSSNMKLDKWDTLYQFIVSPMHGSVIPSLNVPHPALLESAEEPHVFLKLHADTTVTATLEATWTDREGKVVFNVNSIAISSHEQSKGK